MKYLIENSTQKVLSYKPSTVTHNMSGCYIISVPDFVSISVKPTTSGEVTSRGESALKEYFSSYDNHDIYFNPNMVIADLAASVGIMPHPDYGIGILPGGTLVTTTINTGLVSTSNAIFGWNGFTLTQKSGDPHIILYNYDGSSFYDFNPLSLAVSVTSSATASTVVTYNTDISLDLGTGYTIQFDNVTTETQYLSDLYACYK